MSTVDYDGLFRQLEGANISCKRNEMLSTHTTFKIGGPAKIFCEPTSQEEIKTVLRFCGEYGARCYPLGKGSNMLFSDEGYDGVVLHITEDFAQIVVQGTRITAWAGAKLADVCIAAADHGLGGMAWAYGIPGCVGGAVYMNAGAYLGEIKDVLESVSFLSKDGVLHTEPASALALGYRTSLFETSGAVILSATFCLSEESAEEVRKWMNHYAHCRADKQPLDMPSAGSTFKRPAGAFAGALIEQCGLRGFAVGGAAISQKHCGFVVNLGNATCEDVLNLTNRVCEVVLQETGFTLEKEIRVVK